MECSVDEDLALSDIPSKIGDWMSDITVWHSEDRNLGDGTIGTMDTTSAFINSRKIRVHVTRVTTTSWYFFSGS